MSKSSVYGDNPEFDEFWAIYPRKVAKLEARKAWEQTKRTRPTTASLIQALRQHIAVEWSNRPLYAVPHAATWLRGERWEDCLPSTAAMKPDWEAICGPSTATH